MKIATEKNQKIFLLISAIGLTPIALSYGLMPSKSLISIYELSGAETNLFHIFRAVMGLYLALIVFWLSGAFKPQYRQAALYSYVIFMFGLFVGRVISLIMDGIPSNILVFYTVVELVCGAIGLALLSKYQKSNVKIMSIKELSTYKNIVKVNLKHDQIL